MPRTATIERKTTETQILLTINVDGSGTAAVKTGIPFMDHMLTLFARHGFFDLEVQAVGDLDVDAHHTMEDLGLVLGTALRQALGDKHGIRRYGSFYVPMDETLARVVVDLSGRPYLVYQAALPMDTINGLSVRLFQEFFQALTNTLGANLHIDVIRGEEVHHIIEAIFKAFARALDQATQYEARQQGVPSTKGTLA